MTESAGPVAGRLWIGAMVAPRVEPDAGRLATRRAHPGPYPAGGHHRPRPWRTASVAVRGDQRTRQGAAGRGPGRRALCCPGPGGPRCGRGQNAGQGLRRPGAHGLIASPDTRSNVPVWEQEASASCTGYAMVLAANALGLGAVWKSAAVLDTPPVRCLFALTAARETAGLGQRRLAYRHGPRSDSRSRLPSMQLVTVIDIGRAAPRARHRSPRARPSVADEQAQRAVEGRLAAEPAVTDGPSDRWPDRRSAGRRSRFRRAGSTKLQADWARRTSGSRKASGRP